MKKNLILVLLLLWAKVAMSQSHTLTIVSNPGNSWCRTVCTADTGKNSWTNGMIIANWTSGPAYVWRAFLRFDLSDIPSGAVIDSAFLSLYADTTSPSCMPGYPTWGTKNAAGIYRVTSTWDTATIDVLTEPGYTTTDSVILPQSTSYQQDYVNINVSGLIKDCYAYGNYGFVFRELQETTPYNSMVFCTPYNGANDGKVPVLVVKYRTATAVADMMNSKATMDIYPNPCSNNVNIDIANMTDAATIQVRDVVGRTLFTRQISAGHAVIDLNTTDYPRGEYFVSILTSNGNILTKKLVVN